MGLQRPLSVDATLCISLHERSDRREMLLAEFTPTHLPIEFVLVEKDLQDPERGCYHSHQRCAQLALERRLRRVLILEDDATLESWDDAHVTHINRFLTWRRPDIFYLGGILGHMWHVPFPGVVRCRLSGSHAYILSARGCRHLAATPWAGRPLDSTLTKLFRGFAAYPMLSQQQPEDRIASDIADHRFRRLAGADDLKDKEFWNRNRATQHDSVRRNWGRTLMMRWL